MKLITLILCCTSVALIAIACTESVAPTNRPVNSSSTPATATPAAPVATAKLNYAKNCEACHGPNGEGGQAVADGKEIKVPSLTSEHAIKRTDEHIARMIREGDGPMPAFKDKLTPEEITALVAFVRKEFQNK